MAYTEDIHFVPGSERGAAHLSHAPAVFPDMSGTRTAAVADAALAYLYKITKRAGRRPGRGSGTATGDVAAARAALFAGA
ncbi:MAG: hypothetical protein J0I36_14550 [Pandoraea sp.]|uniref:hypothetical protein n=1 Tax=Pandoraea sp. 64-18 TaxID=1895806 RepID=UPI00095F6060|nr:hypothetical protein [Pandoraea sp. 64-18]MBN9116447.1 hypothetical protein [Pandoraea sp.]OJY20743.1 MAG: hypothetical protein BGP02_09825 [Pandoraea sp. 64-18]